MSTATTGTTGDIFVLGSLNADYLIQLPYLPREGETILAHSLTLGVGGKGANQAVAASRLGGNVSFCGAVGDDDDGVHLLRVLRAAKVDISATSIVRSARTGLAMVGITEDGQNSIVVVPGANDHIPRETAGHFVKAARPGSVLVLQGEIPQDVIDGAIVEAAKIGIRCVFNLAPYRDVSPATLAVADPLIVNETECSAACGFAVQSIDDAVRAARQLSTVARSIVVTLGAQGAVWASGDDGGTCPAIQVDKVLDTTGAGDALVGAVALALASGESLENAVTFGVAAGSFAVTQLGTQTSYPTREELREFADDARATAMHQ